MSFLATSVLADKPHPCTAASNLGSTLRVGHRDASCGCLATHANSGSLDYPLRIWARTAPGYTSVGTVLRQLKMLEGTVMWTSRMAADEAVDWESLARLARRFSRHWCRSNEDHEMVAQEALLRLVQRLDHVQSPETWLFVVTRRLARQIRARNSVFVPITGSLGHVGYGAAFNEAEGSAATIRAILEHPCLSRRHRSVLLWSVLGYTHAEIAHRLGCARSAVGRELTRARGRLQACRCDPGAATSGRRGAGQ